MHVGNEVVLESTEQCDADAAMAASLLDMIGASWMSQAICVAAELNILYLLVRRSQTVDELAGAVQCAPKPLYRLLRGLVSLGICTEQMDDSFALTPKGALLCSGTPSLRSWAIWWGRHLWPVWHDLHASIRTGKSVRELATGRKGYAHVENDPDKALLFNCAMAEMTRFVAQEVLRVHDFSGYRRIVDVGGGYGELLSAILAAYPALQGILFDRPHAIENAKTLLANTIIASRSEFVDGDFFESIPSGGDTYLLKSILHNWNDERAALILRNCRLAMKKGSKLLIVERVMPQRMTDTARGRAFARTDLNMLVGLGGCERTEAQFRALLVGAGFDLAGVTDTQAELSVLECALS